MKGFRRTILILILLIGTISFPLGTSARDGNRFVVVIDAGHGGHDPGALGKTAKEKTINLSVALKLGNLIEKNRKDVKVVYTRKTDVFVALNKRAEIANNAKADLFISIHTNALAKNHTMKGASTYTLGLAKSSDNLDVAKRENGVIQFEDGYQTSYQGFDPNSSESYIIFEFMQDQYMSQSVDFASLIQQEFKSYSKRADQGVHQAGFLVLKESAMPSVLVELGFISTPEEERYLSTAEGTTSMAGSIYRAFENYLKEQGQGATAAPDMAVSIPEKESKAESEATQKTATAASNAKSKASSPGSSTSKPVFKIQFLTSGKELKAGDSRLKGLKGATYYKEGGILKYTYQESTDYNQVRKVYNQTVKPKFKDAFIIAFRDGVKMDVNEAIAEFRKNGK